MIEMNRATRILFKTHFLSRQMKALAFGRKYIISERDVENADKAQDSEDIATVEPDVRVAELLDGFDPVNNESDRRILFEVTGIRIYQDEFREQWSSDESFDSDDES